MGHHEHGKCKDKHCHTCYDYKKLNVRCLNAKNLKIKGDVILDGCIKSNSANIDTKCTLGDIALRIESGGPTPADPNAAIGHEVIVTTVNFAIAINDKKTGERLMFEEAETFWEDLFFEEGTPDVFHTDPIITYDRLSKRFIYLLLKEINFSLSANVTIDLPEDLAAESPYAASHGSRAGSTPPFDLSGIEIMAADPLNADTPLTNDLTGKIALIANDGFITPTTNKGNNAFNAGAIGCIFFANEPGVIQNILGSDFIPSVTCTQEVGLAILAKLESDIPVVGGIKSLSEDEVGANGYSNMLLAVSKDSNPKGHDDWYRYEFGGPDGPYKQLLADFPKVGVDEDAIYVSTNSFLYPFFDEGTSTIFAQTVAVAIAPLLDNSAPDPLNLPILLNYKILTNPAAPNSDSNGDAELRLPCLVRPPKTNVQQVMFLVNPIVDFPLDNTAPASGSKFNITSIKNILGVPEIETFEIPVNPWYCPSMFTACEGGRSSYQPFNPEFFPHEYENPLAVEAPRLNYRVIYYKDSLYCSLNACKESSDEDPWEVRWYEFDVSQIFNLAGPGPSVSLKQEGRVKAGDDIDAFYGTINVDKDGNIGLGLNICSHTQPFAMAHTGRLVSDPPGTMRYPLQVNFENKGLPFWDFGFEYCALDKTYASRWNDYTSLEVDPEDDKTFWFCSQYTNNSDADYYNQQWNTGLVNWCVDSICGDTYSAQEPRPEDKTDCPKAAPKAAPKAVSAAMKLKKAQHTEKRLNYIQAKLDELAEKTGKIIKGGSQKGIYYQ